MSGIDTHDSAKPLQGAAGDPSRQIGIWLWVVCAMVFGITVLGGVTRRTGSGLSMVDWRPIFGVVPPLTEAAWLRVFEMYRDSPEYIHLNAGMSLDEFKVIFWFEYAHRMVGRAIGLVFAIPFAYFLIRRKIPAGLTPKLLVMLALGGSQGVLGWYMVMSGLSENPFVSPYRLAAHFGLAMVILVFVLWVALDLLAPRQRRVPTPLRGFRGTAVASTALLALTMLSGAFVAGLKAGYGYNTFPTMGGEWIPSGLLYLEPAWRNLFENLATVQFTHRVLALATTVAVLVVWAYGALRHHGRLGAIARWSLHLLPIAVLGQAALGVATLLLFVPTPLAAAHQGGAVVLLTLLVVLLHQLREPEAGRTHGTVPAGEGASPTAR